MSDKSDEELVGDVDIGFDIDDLIENSSQDKKKSFLRERDTTSEEKQHRQDISHGSKRNESDSSLSKNKQFVKKKMAPVNPQPAGDDLLHAFAAGLPSVKKKPMFGTTKNPGEPGVSKKTLKLKENPVTKHEEKTKNKMKSTAMTFQPEISGRGGNENEILTNTKSKQDVNLGALKINPKKQETSLDIVLEPKRPGLDVVKMKDENNANPKRPESIVNQNRPDSDIAKSKAEHDIEEPNPVQRKQNSGKDNVKLENTSTVKTANLELSTVKSELKISQSKSANTSLQIKQALGSVKSDTNLDQAQIKSDKLDSTKKGAESGNENMKSKPSSVQKIPELNIAQVKEKLSMFLEKQEPPNSMEKQNKEHLEMRIEPGAEQDNSKIQRQPKMTMPQKDETKLKQATVDKCSKQVPLVKDEDNVKQIKEKENALTKDKSIESVVSKAVGNNLSSSLKRKTKDPTISAPNAKMKKEEPLKSTAKEKEEALPFTDDDYKSMDNFLADQMLNKAKEKGRSRSDAKYIVQVSPLEISDLAQPSIQQLIHLHPTTILIFKRQAVKLKKKKGFAEATFSTMTELKEFVYQLTQIKVFEKQIDIEITAPRPKQDPDILSFKIHLNGNAKLLKLIDTGEDPLINKPLPIGQGGHKVQFEKTLASSNGALMHSIFPFTNNILITRTQVGKDTPAYHGPVTVFFINDQWMTAVMECCTDFTVNGFPLSATGSVTTETSCLARSVSAESDQTQEGSGRGADSEEDDLVSSMTRDVCADMLESIKKLKELDSGNPNMKKILEMQKQLSQLQNSLIKPHCLPKEETSSSDKPLKRKELEARENQRKDGKHELDEGHEEKRRKTYHSLEEMLEEADKSECQKEEERKQQRKIEEERQRELHVTRKSRWARKVILDYKQEGIKGEGLSREAEQFLRDREKRMKEKEEEEKRMEEMKKRKVEEQQKQKEEEKMKLEQQRKEEEERKEAERQLLIQKIEEARLKDSEKAEKFSASQLLWNPSEQGASLESPSKHRPHAKSSRRSRELNLPAKKSSSSTTDDGLDQRLADFERELAQQGKIEKRMDAVSPIKSDTHSHSRREKGHDLPVVFEDEYQNLLSRNQLHTLPSGCQIRLTSMVNRYCPVPDCPAKTCFKTEETFMEHWSIFHKAEQTMRFCPKCSAYFMNFDELENHIMKHHRLSSRDASKLLKSARVKVIPNPSFRDPFPFLPPS